MLLKYLEHGTTIFSRLLIKRHGYQFTTTAVVNSQGRRIVLGVF